MTSVLIMYYPRLLLPLDLQDSEYCTEVTWRVLTLCGSLVMHTRVDPAPAAGNRYKLSSTWGQMFLLHPTVIRCAATTTTNLTSSNSHSLTGIPPYYVFSIFPIAKLMVITCTYCRNCVLNVHISYKFISYISHQATF